jgi:hypothetical protein
MGKVPEISDNMKFCICQTCPTYKKCNLTDALFCAKGKAKEKAKKEGCICNKCGVYAKYNLKGSYFCRKPAKMMVDLGNSSNHNCHRYHRRNPAFRQFFNTPDPNTYTSTNNYTNSHSSSNTNSHTSTNSNTDSYASPNTSTNFITSSIVPCKCSFKPKHKNSTPPFFLFCIKF